MDPRSALPPTPRIARVPWPTMSAASSSGFAIETGQAGDDTLIAVRGELDLSTAPALAAALGEAATTSAASVTLDLSAITFIDSSALRVLVQGGRDLQSSGKALRIGGRSAVVTRVLAMTNLDTASESFRLLPEL